MDFNNIGVEDWDEMAVEDKIEILNEGISLNLKEELNDDDYVEYVKLGMSLLTTQLGQSIGIGLFATRDFRKGAIIGVYRGEILPTQVANADDYKSDYVADLGNGNSIDSNHPFYCFTRYINDGITNERNNCGWRKFGRGNVLKIVALRYINAGEEFYLSYGNFWADHQKFNILSNNYKYLLYMSRPDVKEWIDNNYYIDEGGNFIMDLSAEDNNGNNEVIDLTVDDEN